MTDIQKRLYRAEGPVPVGYKDTPIGFLPNEWGYASLGDLSVELTETAGQKTYETVSISAGIGFVNQAEKFGKELSGKQYEKYIVLRKGDFSYNKGNSNRYPQGCIYRLNDREEAAVPNVFESFRIVKGCPEYYEQLFISGFLNHQLFRLINHGVRDDGLLNLTGTDFYSCLLPVPPVKEQERIADLLSTFDSMISRYEEIAEQYRTLKKHLLNNMFPKGGSAVPEIRFPGFTDAWEQCKYSDAIDLCSGQDFEPSGYNDEENGVPYMTGASCIENGATVASRWTDSPKCLAYKGDVLLVCKGSGYGTIAMLEQEKAHIARQFMALRCRDILDSRFNYYLAHSVVSDIKKDARGLIAGIARDAVLNEQIALPSREEQKEIGDFFHDLDNFITLHQREAEMWKTKKKALSQLLLTGIVRV